jgi:Carboxypeptidase regulatory-like domain
MRVWSGLLVVLAVARFLAYASPAYPQGSTAVAQLNGTVLDESGGTVKGATVALRQTDTNRSYTTSSNDSGYYAVVNLPPGHYEVTTAIKGFVTTVHKSIDLSVGQFATIDVALKVATHGEIVVVTSETPVIEPTKTEISQVINTQEISSLPIKDPKQNGGRSLEDILHHIADDDLVGWGWNPGEGRTLPPLSRPETVAQLKIWMEGGAACPE